MAPAGGGPSHDAGGRSKGTPETQENEEIIERVAALDIGKPDLVCCLRVPDEDHRGRRLQEVDSYSTMTRPLLSMADRLRLSGGDAGGDGGDVGLLEAAFYTCWRAAGFEAWLVNAQDVKHLPGPAEDRQAGRGLAVQGR